MCVEAPEEIVHDGGIRDLGTGTLAAVESGRGSGALAAMDAGGEPAFRTRPIHPYAPFIC